MKNIFKSKTIWASLIITLLPLVMSYLTPEQLAAWGINPYIVSLIGVLFGWLRTITSEPLTIKKSEFNPNDANNE